MIKDGYKEPKAQRYDLHSDSCVSNRASVTPLVPKKHSLREGV